MSSHTGYTSFLHTASDFYTIYFFLNMYLVNTENVPFLNTMPVFVNRYFVLCVSGLTDTII